jgi:glycine cleavage system H protein
MGALADYEIPEDLRYTSDDEWVREEEDRVDVGITDFAQEQLGDIVFVELPRVGSIITKGDAFGVIESVKAVSDLFAPVSGAVVAINEELEEHPEIVNADCYLNGWLVAIEDVEPEDLEDLLDAAAYRLLIEERTD